MMRASAGWRMRWTCDHELMDGVWRHEHRLMAIWLRSRISFIKYYIVGSFKLPRILAGHVSIQPHEKRPSHRKQAQFFYLLIYRVICTYIQDDYSTTQPLNAKPELRHRLQIDPPPADLPQLFLSYRMPTSSKGAVRFVFGRSPNWVRWLQIRWCRLSHRSRRLSNSAADARHLLFRIRRMASGDTSNCSARTGVVNLSGAIECRCRIPSRASGDSFLTGFHPSLNFSCRAVF